MRKEVNKMEKECCQIKFIETDKGFKIEVEGMTMKQAISSCCIPIGCCMPKAAAECCPPKKEKE
jgi:hypothetical protein